MKQNINMQTQLKDKIIKDIQENKDESKIVNFITNYYRDYIYDKQGNYLIGGEEVANFIREFITLYTK